MGQMMTFPEMAINTGTSPASPPAPRAPKGHLSWLHRHPADAGVRQKDQKKAMLRWPVDTASGAAFNQPGLSGRRCPAPRPQGVHALGRAGRGRRSASNRQRNRVAALSLLGT